MKFHKYSNIHEFERETLDILMEDEAQNNLPISFITRAPEVDTSDWLLGAVKNASGHVSLVAACTPPFNLTLYAPQNLPNGEAVALLARSLRQMGCEVPGVLAEQVLARRFAEEYSGTGSYSTKISMNVMRLDSLPAKSAAQGFLREITHDDLFFLPYWMREFARDCGLEHHEIDRYYSSLEKRPGKQSLYVWQDGVPVSMVAFGRKLINGAVINQVYTPPFLRGRGYSRAAVGTLCRELFDRGNRFIALFADAANPVSCGLYHSLGFTDICLYDELHFAAREVKND